LPAYAEQPAMEAADMALANQVKAALDQDQDLAKLNLVVTNKKGTSRSMAP
jgi:histidinol phosphatase-like enzyme